MIRDRLKAAARRAAIRLLRMEDQVAPEEPARPARRGAPAPATLDRAPPVVDGSGDTPGPNHKSDIGRTFAAAQLAAGGAVFLDVRDPEDLAAGWIPGALRVPGDGILARTDLLPRDRDVRVVVYDQDGDGPSARVAEALRRRGWPWARRLVGGFAEWLEAGEPVDRPSGDGPAPGDPVRLPDGRRARVLEVHGDGASAWTEDGELVDGLDPDGLGR